MNDGTKELGRELKFSNSIFCIYDFFLFNFKEQHSSNVYEYRSISNFEEQQQELILSDKKNVAMSCNKLRNSPETLI